MKQSSTQQFFLVLVVVVMAGFWLIQAPEVTTLEDSSGIIQPLILQADLSALTLEQKREIADFRKLILARIKSNTPLTDQEKIVIRASLLEKKRETPGGGVLVDQSTYQFNDNEIRMISEALGNE